MIMTPMGHKYVLVSATFTLLLLLFVVVVVVMSLPSCIVAISLQFFTVFVLALARFASTGSFRFLLLFIAKVSVGGNISV